MTDPNKYITYASNEDWDIHWDLTVGAQGIFMKYGSDAIAQNIEERLKMFLGEWEYDTTQGTAWFEKVYVRPLNLSNAESELKKRVIKTPGVIKLLEFNMGFDKANRMINSVEVAVLTEDGKVRVSV